jgi:glucosamine kinase
LKYYLNCVKIVAVIYMNYYLGIDGGGTKTKVCLINENKEILYEATSGPSSIDTVTPDLTLRSFCSALSKIEEKLGFFPEFDGVFAGVGGIVTKDHEEIVEALLTKLPGVNEKTKVQARNDMEIALASSLCKEGIAIIVGTGMVAFGKKAGRTHKSGGWGFKEGEIGSAYDLGMQAIQMMIRAYDNRIPKTAFTEEVYKRLGMERVTDFIQIMDQLWGKRTEIASLAPLVTKFADQNDPHCLKIIEKSTDEIALAVRGVYKTLEMNAPTLVVIGSLGNSEGRFRTMLHEKIHGIDAKINIIAPQVDPAYAAALLASDL